MYKRQITERFAEALRRSERYATIPNQIVLADFLSSGQFAKHLRRCREASAERRQALIEALKEECADMLTFDRNAGGLHICAKLAPKTDDTAIANAAREAGIVVEPLSAFYADTPAQPGLLLGFAGFRPDALRDATARLAAVLRSRVGARGRAAG